MVSKAQVGTSASAPLASPPIATLTAPIDPPASAELVIEAKKPVYGLMAELAVRGVTYQEIAKRTGYSYGQVKALFKSEEFQHLVQDVRKQLVKEIGFQEFTGLMPLALANIQDILTGLIAAPASERLNASKFVVEHSVGKPAQRIEVEHQNKAPDQELRSLDDQLNEILGQLRDASSGRLGGGVRELSTHSSDEPK